MTNFIENSGTLPFPKSDLVAVPTGADPSKYVAATDWNAACQALMDVQTFARGAHFFGLTPNNADPTPAGVSDYLYMDASGNVHVKAGATDTTLGTTSTYADGKTITGAGTVASPFVAVRSYLNVKDYGAKGDGVTDDASSIATAISAASTQGIPLWFPSGTYVLGSTITLPVTNYLHLIGTNATFSYTSITREAFWTQSGSSNLRFEGLAWQGSNNDNKTQNIYAAVRIFNNTTDIIFERCTFTQSMPIQCDDSYLTRRLHFVRNFVHNAPNGVHPCSDSVIEDCDFVCDSVVSGASGRGQAIYIYGQQNNCAILNCRFRNLAEEDIQIRASAASWNIRSIFRIEGCHFENSYSYSIWCGSDATPDIGQFIISGNTFKNCNGPIYCFGARTAVITSNLIEFDWQYPYTMPSGASGIGVVGGIGQPYHLQTARGTVVANNKLLIHHPWVATITVNSIPADGDTITVGDITYTWRTTATAAFDVLIGSSTQSCAAELAGTLQGNDGGRSTVPTNAARYAPDVFNNYYGNVYNSGPTNEVVVVGGLTFGLSFTGTAVSTTGPIDYRQACPYAISVTTCINPVIQGNHMDDFVNGIQLTQTVQPAVYDNTLSDRSGAAACYFSSGNVLSHYRGNRTLQQNYLQQGRPYHNYCSDAFPVIEDNWVESQQLTVPSCTGRSGVVATGTGVAYAYFYYGQEISGSIDEATLPYRWNDGDAVILSDGTNVVTLTFQRSTPGAGQFNSADALISAINAATFGGIVKMSAAYETVVNNLGAGLPKMLIKVTDATGPGTAGNSYSIQVRRYKSPTDTTTYLTVPQPLLTGIILRNNSADAQAAYFYGGAATASATFVHTPIANAQRGVTVQGVDSTSQALNPVVYQSNIIPGVGFLITHTAGSGNFFFRVN